jgi:hypothetical protein
VNSTQGQRQHHRQLQLFNLNMIFYHPDCDLRFSDYGIEIPIEDDRAKKVFEYLKSHYPNLNYTDLNSLAQISRQDLLLVHKK